MPASPRRGGRWRCCTSRTSSGARFKISIQLWAHKSLNGAQVQACKAEQTSKTETQHVMIELAGGRRQFDQVCHRPAAKSAIAVPAESIPQHCVGRHLRGGGKLEMEEIGFGRQGDGMLKDKASKRDHPCLPCCPPSLRRLSERIADASPDFIKQAEFLKKVPVSWRSGPWSVCAIAWMALVIPTICFAIPVWASVYAPSLTEWPARRPAVMTPNCFMALAALRGMFGLGFLFIALMPAFKGMTWIFCTYTIQHFTLLTLRLLLSALSMAPGLSFLADLATVLRYPALCGTVVTVVIWWLVLVPIIHLGLRDDAKKRAGFWAFNMSPTLLIVHGLNFPVAIAEFMLSGVPLLPIDLWFGLLYAVLYLTFYLLVLDANHIFYYVILTPRIHASCLVYSGIAAMYVGIYNLANQMLLQASAFH